MSSASTSLASEVPKLLPWLVSSTKCTCTFLDRIKARITDFNDLYSIILHSDKAAYDQEKESSSAATKFENAYLNEWYSNLKIVTDLLHLVSLESGPLEEIPEITDEEIKERLGDASKRLSALRSKLGFIRKTTGIPAAMTGERLDRLSQAEDLVLAMQNGWTKVHLKFCIYHAFVDDQYQQFSTSCGSKTRFSDKSGKRNGHYATRNEHAGQCESCHGTVLLKADGNKRSLHSSIASEDYFMVMLRAWDTADPLGSARHPRQLQEGEKIDLTDTPWFQMSIAPSTGEYTLEHLEGHLGEWASVEQTSAFMASLCPKLRHVLQRDVGNHKVAMSGFSEVSVAPTILALSDAHERLRLFDPMSRTNRSEERSPSTVSGMFHTSR